MPGSADKDQDLGHSCKAHLGDQEHALGLRSHGCWAVANLAPSTASIPGSWAPAPYMVPPESGTPSCGQTWVLAAYPVPTSDLAPTRTSVGSDPSSTRVPSSWVLTLRLPGCPATCRPVRLSVWLTSG